MLRVVIDPGVLVSAHISGQGAPAELIRRWIEGQIDILVSPLLLEELDGVLHRPKLRRRELLTSDLVPLPEKTPDRASRHG